MNNITHYIKYILSLEADIIGRLMANENCKRLAAWHRTGKHLLPKETVKCFYGSDAVSRSSARAQKKLSIIVPAYNSQNFIDRLLEALVSQTADDAFEIIIINDGSTDQTAEILNSWKHRYPNLIFVINQDNAGIAAARNTGLAHATGEYVGFIDHDDMVDRQYVQVLLEEARTSDADCVKCAYSIEYTQTANSTAHFYNREVYETDGTCDLYEVGGYIWGGIYKASIFKNLSFPTGCWYEDIITVPLVYRQCNRIRCINSVLYKKIEHDRNASALVWNRRSKKSIDQLYLTKEIVSANDCLGLSRDAGFYRSIVRELSYVLWERTRGLPHALKIAIFDYASRLITEVVDTSKLPKLDETDALYAKSLLNGCYLSWVCLSIGEYSRRMQSIR